MCLCSGEHAFHCGGTKISPCPRRRQAAFFAKLAAAEIGRIIRGGLAGWKDQWRCPRTVEQSNWFAIEVFHGLRPSRRSAAGAGFNGSDSLLARQSQLVFVLVRRAGLSAQNSCEASSQAKREFVLAANDLPASKIQRPRSSDVGEAARVAIAESRAPTLASE
jgi:hypothetical protein